MNILQDRVIRIKPLELDKWHGKKGKDSFSRPRVIEALYDPQTGRYATGLTKEEMKELSKLLGIEINDIFVPNKTHPVWGENKAFKLTLPNHTIFLNLNSPTDYVKYKLALASKFVANSYKDWIDGKYPDATHYIDDEEITVQVEYEKVKSKQEAYGLLAKMSLTQKRSLANILYGNDLSNVSDELVDVKLASYIEKNADEFVKYAKLKKEDIGMMSLIIKAENKSIVKRVNGVYYYGDMRLGITLFDAAEFLKDTNNQDILITIKEKLNS